MNASLVALLHSLDAEKVQAEDPSTVANAAAFTRNRTACERPVCWSVIPNLLASTDRAM